MKKSKVIVAIIVLAIMATTVAVVSCKKDNGNDSSQKEYTIQQPADIRQMEDPRSYMIDFKKKLTESKDNEAFSLDDAAWHLACLANLDFCNVNVKYDDFQFDTIEMQVNVTDDIILLSDLRSAYEQMCAEIQQFKKGFNHCDQNMYYINVSINTDGNAKIALMTSFTTDSKDDNHAWYFSSFLEAVNVGYDYFSSDSIYVWDSAAVRELTRVLNLIEHHENYWSNGTLVWVYFPTRVQFFDYSIIDYEYSYNGFYNNSRVFAIKDHNEDLDYDLSFFQIIYCFDSYLGLGYNFINAYPHENPVCWKIIPTTYHPENSNWYYHYHQLKVEYGQLITPNLPGPEPN